MGLLDGGIAKAIYKGFKGKLLKGQLRVETAVGGLDDAGDPIASTVAYYRVEGFVDLFSEFYKKQAGIPDSDMKVSIFSASVPGVEIQKDHKIWLKGNFGVKWYQVRVPRIDPAGALWECQAFEIEAPIDGS